jgi:putative hydrolase of the HAD superfamily
MTTHILFDFFGTLVRYSPSRTEQGYERSFRLVTGAGARCDYAAFLDLWSEVSAEFDRGAEQTLREFSMLEVGHAFLCRALRRTPEVALVEEFVAAYLAEWNQGVGYLEGIQQLLKRLASRYTLSIVTNTHQPDLVPKHLDEMGVSERFRAVVTSVEFGLRKPHPGIFAHALDRLRAESQECVYVGDDFEADYQGARSAGLESLLIDPMHRTPVPAAARLGSIFELEERLGWTPSQSGSPTG